MAIDPTLRDALSAVTTASIARALERAAFGTSRLWVLSARTGGTTIVGPAHTLRMVPARARASATSPRRSNRCPKVRWW